MRCVDTRAAFNRLVGGLEYPMFIVTARAGDEPLGCLVGFATQMSIDPPRFAVCLSHENRTLRRGRDARVPRRPLPSRADADALAELFGGETADEVDKFARCAWHAGPEDVPILDDCANWFVGRVVWRARRRRSRRVPARAGRRRGAARRGRVHVPPRQAHRSRARGLMERFTAPARRRRRGTGGRGCSPPPCPVLPPDDRPFLLVNMIATADGSATVAGRPARSPTGRLRAVPRAAGAVDAVMVGAETVRVEGYGRLIVEAEARRRASATACPRPARRCWSPARRGCPPTSGCSRRRRTPSSSSPRHPMRSCRRPCHRAVPARRAGGGRAAAAHGARRPLGPLRGRSGAARRPRARPALSTSSTS